jgi:hypothetical protein
VALKTGCSEFEHAYINLYLDNNYNHSKHLQCTLMQQPDLMSIDKCLCNCIQRIYHCISKNKLGMYSVVISANMNSKPNMKGRCLENFFRKISYDQTIFKYMYSFSCVFKAILNLKYFVVCNSRNKVQSQFFLWACDLIIRG